MGAEGRGLCTAAGTGRGGGASPALRVAACSTAVSTGLRAAPGSPGDGEGVEGALPCWGPPRRRLRSAPCWGQGAKGTVAPARPGDCAPLLPTSVLATSPGAASAVRCFGSRGAAVRAERELRRAPHLRRGALRCCAPGRAAARGGERSPGRCPGTAARGCPQLPGPPAVPAAPSRELQWAPVAKRSSLREGLMFAKCLLSISAWLCLARVCARLTPLRLGFNSGYQIPGTPGKGLFVLLDCLVRFVRNIYKS